MRVGYYQISNRGLVRYCFIPKALLRSTSFNFDEVFFALNLKTPVRCSQFEKFSVNFGKNLNKYKNLWEGKNLFWIWFIIWKDSSIRNISHFRYSILNLNFITKKKAFSMIKFYFIIILLYKKKKVDWHSSFSWKSIRPKIIW